MTRNTKSPYLVFERKAMLACLGVFLLTSTMFFMSCTSSSSSPKATIDRTSPTDDIEMTRLPSVNYDTNIEPDTIAELSTVPNNPDIDVGVGTDIGNKISSFNMYTADGNIISSRDLLLKDTQTFLFFFATW